MRTNDVSRRDFLAAAITTGLAAGALNPFNGATWAGILPPGGPQGRMVFKSGFEKGQPQLAAGQHTLSTEMAHGGSYAMEGRVDAASKACFLEIPFESKAGRVLHISYWVRSDRGSACATFIRSGQERRPIGRRLDKIPTNTWHHVQVFHEIERDVKGYIQIVAPSSFNAPAGRAWIDDVEVVEVDSVSAWPGCVEDFGVVACDASGRVYMATIERPEPKGRIGVYRLTDGQRQRICAFDPSGHTGVFSPAMAAADEGCVVAFAVERDDRWRIAHACVDGGPNTPSLRYIDCGGNANISPAVVIAGSRACIVWESNADGCRSVYSCFVDRKGCGAVERISAGGVNSYNPSIVVLPDGRLFAAWDSVRDRSADIFGAWYCDGTWQAESRVTSDARIERHPHLAVRGDEVWMAWQAQSYAGFSINALREQRIGVARIDGGRPAAPAGLFEDVSTGERLLMRPRIAFDGDGRLWLSARQSMGPQAGWQALLWHYGKGGWSEPDILVHRCGRWRPIEIAPTPAGVACAVQYDDLPDTWAQRGIFRDWRSGIVVRTAAVPAESAKAALKTEPLQFPETSFSLSEKIDLCAAELPRATWDRPDKRLALYWGDFHDHTDISVCGRSVNPPGHDLFANERDIERLDFCALTDHGYNFDPPQWAYNGAQTRNNHDPGRFVTFLGQEWTSSKNPPAPGSNVRRYGHRNLVFLDPHHASFHDADDGDISPADVWRLLEGTEFICIPHQLADWQGKGGGNPPTDWSFVDERLQPVAEICQARQSYEYLGCPRQAPQGAPFKGYYLQDAWAKGIVIGVIASPDHGGGRGKVGVWAEALTREAIFAAVRARHTFGTSGAKMMLKFSAGEAMMGDMVQRPAGEIAFRIEAVALQAIKEVVIFRNNAAVFTAHPNATGAALTWVDASPPDMRLWYYARIQAVDDELAWSSPIWYV